MTVQRGTSNSDARGSTANRAARRSWLLSTYAADVVILIERDDTDKPVLLDTGRPYIVAASAVGTPGTDAWEAACRCYRCGCLLTADTLTVDRVVPGCQGGTYRRNNIRPACAWCNSSTGGRTRSKP